VPSGESGARASIMDWRRAERARLIEARLRAPVAQRQAASGRIAGHLESFARERGLLAPGTTISGYWPLRGEPDLRPWLARMHEAGLTCVLPVVVEKGAPLVFRRWSPGCPMEKGFWDIPIPAARGEFIPDVLLAPVVGFDARCYRLGYGGGYFDRTLEQLLSRSARYCAIGVGYEMARLQSIRPLPHDIALQAIVTEAGAAACN
jgi:5,10-methenyltetrahydrofolate synthetase